MWLSYKFLRGIFSKGTKPFDFIKPNLIQKLPHKLKHIVKLLEF